MSDFLSGPTSVPGYSPEPHSLIDPIQIGVSTQEEVIGALGNPTDRQQSLDETPIESWAYVSHGETVQPYQYVLLLGAFASSRSLLNESPSVAFGFTPNGVVSGLTVSTLNAYGDIPPHELLPISNTSIPLYGTRNPQVAHTPRTTNSQFP